MQTKNQHIAKCKSCYTPSGKNIEMDFSWYLALPAMTRDVLVAGVYKPNLNNPRLFQNGDVYRIWRNNGNVEFYVNGLLDGTFPDKYPDRPMYLEAVFYDVNKKVENLYIYKEVLKTHDTIQTTEMVAKVDGYKYGFQAQERDDEIKGAGNSYNYTFRMHDSRLGRFFAVDPLVWKYPFYSSYQFSSNSPIFTIELEGLESSYLINYTEKNSITLTKNEKNQFVIDMKEVDKLDQQYRENIQGANFSRPHDATPAPGKRVQAISSGSKDVHAWTIIIPKNATVTTNEDIHTMNQQQNLATQNTRITPSKPDKTQSGTKNVPQGSVNVGPNPVPPGGNLWVNINAQFAPNTTNITNNNEINRVINNVAGALLANPNNSITIYASSKLPTGANWNTNNTAVGMTFGQLADQRNQVIADKLIELGVNPNQINMKRGRSDAMRVNGNFRNNAPAETPSSP